MPKFGNGHGNVSEMKDLLYYLDYIRIYMQIMYHMRGNNYIRS